MVYEATTETHWVWVRVTGLRMEGSEYGVCLFLLPRYPNVHSSLLPLLSSFFAAKSYP